jgi:hypothetical protein
MASGAAVVVSSTAVVVSPARPRVNDDGDKVLRPDADAAAPVVHPHGPRGDDPANDLTAPLRCVAGYLLVARGGGRSEERVRMPPPLPRITAAVVLRHRMRMVVIWLPQQARGEATRVVLSSASGV